MTTTYRMAGLVAPAAAPRARRSAVATCTSAWSSAAAPFATDSSMATPFAAVSSMAIVPATKQLGDVLDHRRRRLSEPSP